MKFKYEGALSKFIWSFKKFINVVTGRKRDDENDNFNNPCIIL